MKIWILCAILLLYIFWKLEFLHIFSSVYVISWHWMGIQKKQLNLTFTPLTLLWWEQFLLSNTHFVHHTWCCSSSTVPILGAFGNTLGERTGSLWPFGNSLLKFTVWKFRNQCQCTRRSDLGYDAPVCQVAQAGNWLRTEAAFGKHFEWTLLCLSEHTPSE